jgi:hypothetical protein
VYIGYMKESSALQLIKDRAERFDTLAEFAQAHNVSLPYVYKVFSGERQITQFFANKFGLVRHEKVTFTFKEQA